MAVSADLGETLESVMNELVASGRPAVIIRQRSSCSTFR